MSDASDEELEPGALIVLKDMLISPLRKPYSAVTSKPAQKFYLSTFLAFLGGSILFIIAIAAYIVFYYSYVPARGLTKPIYLQFGANHPPYGYASIAGSLVSYQPYDVKVLLHMPRTPSNKAAGNFMVDVRLVAPGSMLDAVMDDDSKILGRSSRPAILNYQSATMELVHQGVGLPWHLIGWKEEAEVLKVPMIEGIEFLKGWRNIPDQVRLELRSAETLQVYSAKIEITAKLRGLRYLMYNYRLTSFAFLTTVFWFVELIVTAVVWFSLNTYLTYVPPRDQVIKEEAIKREAQVKTEDDELSDTPHTFPTLSGQPPLRYTSPRVKKEETDDVSAEQPPAVGEQADDEDEEADFVRDDLADRAFTDSGIGTSMESGGTRASVRRRRSGRFDGE